MRVNVDSQALRDPRFRRAAKRLNVSHHEVLSRAICVWMVCYERREPVITREDIDIAAELDGFCDALCASELAEPVNGGGDVYVRGVSERIAFLEKQSERGKRSGQTRRELSAELQKRTSVQQTFDLALNQGTFNGRSSNGSTDDRTYSPDQAPDLQDLDHQHRSRTRTADVGDESPTPHGTTVQTENVAPAASHAVSEPIKTTLPDPPDDAVTLSVLLLDHVVANHPGSRVANSARKKRDAMITRWAWVLEKLHRLDGQSWGAIHGMILWSAKHSFWNKAILGADSLRENWDKMNAQRNRQTMPNGRNEPRRGPTAQALDEVAAMEAAAAADKSGDDGEQ